MKRKIRLLLSCLACCAMLAYGMMITEAALCPQHEYEKVYAMPTGRVTWDNSYHYIEYGTKYVCVNCGYDYFTDTYDEKRPHDLKWVHEEKGGSIYSYQCCTGCNYSTKK